MNILLDYRLEQAVQLREVVGGQVVVISQALGLLAKGTRGLADVFVFYQNGEMLGGAITAAFVLATWHRGDLQQQQHV